MKNYNIYVRKNDMHTRAHSKSSKAKCLIYHHLCPGLNIHEQWLFIHATRCSVKSTPKMSNSKIRIIGCVWVIFYIKMKSLLFLWGIVTGTLHDVLLSVFLITCDIEVDSNYEEHSVVIIEISTHLINCTLKEYCKLSLSELMEFMNANTAIVSEHAPFANKEKNIWAHPGGPKICMMPRN